MSDNLTKQYRAAIIGGGPAGTGPLVYGAWSGRLGELLERGVAVIESGNSLGSGRLGQYAINSNSTGSTFIECLEHGISSGYLKGSTGSPLHTEIDRLRTEVLPLELAARMLDCIGGDLLSAIESSPASQAYLGTRAQHIRMLGPGKFEIGVTPETPGDPAFNIIANRILIAAGGHAQIARDAGGMVVAACADNGVSDLPMMVTSERLLTETGRSGVEAWLDNFDTPEMLVVGGAHSALSSVWIALERMHGDFTFGDGSISVLCRSRAKVFYESIEEAQRDGFSAFSDEDVCAKGRIFPIGGLRGDAKQLYRRITGLGDSPVDKRINMLPLPASRAQWAALPLNWKNLALVVFATGYVLPEVQICGNSGAPIELHGSFTERYVDQSSRLLDASGEPIPGLYASGFTTGFSPTKMLDGESSYRGKENSVWLCQHQLGEQLFNVLNGA